jgi:hypothetical protein
VTAGGALGAAGDGDEHAALTTMSSAKPISEKIFWVFIFVSPCL